jgi:hypothetical protein
VIRDWFWPPFCKSHLRPAAGRWQTVYNRAGYQAFFLGLKEPRDAEKGWGVGRNR